MDVNMKLVEALQYIAGEKQPVDNLLSDKEIARIALYNHRALHMAFVEPVCPTCGEYSNTAKDMRLSKLKKINEQMQNTLFVCREQLKKINGWSNVIEPLNVLLDGALTAAEDSK